MRLAACVSVIALAACVSPYKQLRDGQMSGYRDWSPGPGRHHVEYALDPSIGPVLGRQYLHRRCLEVCASEGASGYEIDPASRGSESSGYRSVSIDIRCTK